MKISFVTEQLGRTGGNLTIYMHLDNLVKWGHDAYLILPNRKIKWSRGIWKNYLSDKHSIKEELRKKIKKYDRLNLRGKIKNIKGHFDNYGLAKLNRWLRCIEKYYAGEDVLIATYWTTAYPVTYMSEKANTFYYCQHYEEIFFRKDQWRDRILCRSTYGMPINLIVNSEWLQNQLQKRFNRDSYRINHAITNPGLFSISENDCREKFCLSDKIQVVSYCDPRPFKGWDCAVEAMRIVQAKYPNVNWVTFGADLDAKGVRVDNRGKINDETLSELYKTSQIGFLSSIYESFPLQPLEMMSCGCAVVTTPYGTEAYSKDHENCLIAKPGDPKDMAEKIIYLSNDLNFARSLAINGIETSRVFSWEKSTKRLLEIIELAKKNNKFSDINEFLVS